MRQGAGGARNQNNQIIIILKISLCVIPVYFFNATFQCSIGNHLLINEQWSDDQKELPTLSQCLPPCCVHFSALK
jgi:hypothetical protein